MAPTVHRIHHTSGAQRRVRATPRGPWRTRTPLRAFTLVELLVVIAIVALLIAVLVIAGGAVMDDAKKKETLSVLHVLEMAVEQFHDDAPLRRVTDANGNSVYRDRYGDYPCDELEPFRKELGIPGTDPPVTINPGGGVGDLHIPTGMNLVDVTQRDVKAMTLVIRLYSPEASATLDKIGNRYWRSPQPTTAAEFEFFDRNATPPTPKPEVDDQPLAYVVDSWGTPIEYFALHEHHVGEPGALPAASTDTPVGDRIRTSTFLLTANHHKPVFVSYGPDGPDQVAQVIARNPGPPGGALASPLVEDFSASDPLGVEGVIDHPHNADNVYTDDELSAKLGVSQGD